MTTILLLLMVVCNVILLKANHKLFQGQFKKDFKEFQDKQSEIIEKHRQDCKQLIEEHISLKADLYTYN